MTRVLKVGTFMTAVLGDNFWMKATEKLSIAKIG